MQENSPKEDLKEEIESQEEVKFGYTASIIFLIFIAFIVFVAIK